MGAPQRCAEATGYAWTYMHGRRTTVCSSADLSPRFLEFAASRRRLCRQWWQRRKALLIGLQAARPSPKGGRKNTNPRRVARSEVDTVLGEAAPKSAWQATRLWRGRRLSLPPTTR